VTLAKLVADHRILVCVGSGGVGKTTIAAAVALRAALDGRRAMVLTIDPARRLAQSLGLDALRAGGEVISAARFEEAGLAPRGTLSAGMLDVESAWDAFIARHAPSDEVRATILANGFYQQLSRTFAGSTEYMAIEELGRLDESGEYDLIVLDTPPAGYALDFLEAPLRLEAFLAPGVLSRLVAPSAAAGWSVWKQASRGARFLLERVEQATGVQALADIAAFFVSIERLVDGITERSRSVRALLQGTDTAFVLVAGPDEQVMEDAEDLTRRMRALGMPLRGVVMNRVHPGAAVYEDDAALEVSLVRVMSALEQAGACAETRAWMLETMRRRRLQWAAEAVRREAFERGLAPDVPIIDVPERDGDVHDLAGLADIGRWLVA